MDIDILALAAILLLTACTQRPSIIKPIAPSSISSETISIASHAAKDQLQVEIAHDWESIQISKNNQTIRQIGLNDIPPFDTDYVGKPSLPRRDYLFNNAGIIDQKRNRLYFTVRNQSTAGNVNANTALFAYDLSDGSIGLILTKGYTNGFGTMTLSPDDHYLVFSHGSHGGMCYNTLGLIVFDLDMNKEIANLFLPNNTVGWIKFLKWLNNSQFTYVEKTFKNRQNCLQESEENPYQREKTYTIQSAP